MRKSFFAINVGAAVLVAALAVVVNVRAVSTSAMLNTGTTEEPLTRLGAGSPVDALRGAYATLASADHDYKGHRVKAMKAIEAACKLLGTDISGDGKKPHEPQPISDAQLRGVLGVVQQVSASIPAGKTQKKIVTHLNTAVSELNIALTIK